MLTPTVVFVLIGLTLAALACVRRIPEGQAYTLRRVGGHMRTIGAGTHLVLPLLERVAHRIRLLGNVVDLDRLPGTESGRACGGQIYFQVLDAGRADSVIDGVDGLVRGCLAAVPDSAAGEDPVARNQRVKLELNRQLRERGILITRVQLSDV